MVEKLTALSQNGHAEVDEIFPLVYRELRDRAERCLNSLPPGQSLAPTDLVHEAFIKLSKNGRTDWNSDEHFVAAAAMAMRQIASNAAAQSNVAVSSAGSNCSSMHRAPKKQMINFV